MMKAIFLDRDGTLNVDKGDTYRIEDFELHDGVIDGLRILGDFRLFIVTNQSGIGRGCYTEEDLHRFNDYLHGVLKKQGISIEKVYFSPDTHGKQDSTRKPNPYFLRQAEKEYGISLLESWMIGDRDIDMELANNAGCKWIYVLTGHGTKHLAEARLQKPSYIAANFLQAAQFITAKKETKIVERKKLSSMVRKYREKGEKIVTLNGTFDILHKGHEKMLTEAKEQGDILIVAVNSDESVKGNKGPARPLNNERARALMIANFDYVDCVTIFPEKTPIELLEIIRPDVHVNGSEYGSECIEAQTVGKYGGRIHIVRLLPGYSSTKIISGKSGEKELYSPHQN